jgi:hypothetical protein
MSSGLVLRISAVPQGQIETMLAQVLGQFGNLVERRSTRVLNFFKEAIISNLRTIFKFVR